MLNAKLGDVIEHNAQPFRIVRIIMNSTTLYEPEVGETYVVEESYLELKGADGAVEFISLREEEKPFTGPSSLIRALEPPMFVRYTTRRKYAQSPNPDGVKDPS